MSNQACDLPKLAFSEIEAGGRIYQRRAWTGGDTPPEGFSSPEYDAVVDAFYREQMLHASFDGTLTEDETLNFWPGTSAEERKAIFMNRARLDAWRTINP